MENESRLYKIAFLHAGVVTIGFLVFLAAIVNTIISDRQVPQITTIKKDLATRGEIYSKDGRKLVDSTKIYKAAINTKSLNKDKKELFVKLFSIYSDIDEKDIRKKLDTKKGYLVLSYNIDSKRARELKVLNYKLNRLQVFNSYESKKLKKTIFPGLDVIESGEKRVYNYEDRFEPYLGYVTKREKNSITDVYGVKGLEKFYDFSLSSNRDGFIKGKRDRASNVIVNNDTQIQLRIDGLKLLLNIDLELQTKIEASIDKFKTEFEAKEIVCAVMDSKTGKLYSLATTNRFDANHIKEEDIGNLDSTVSERPFEIGSIMKPLVFSMLLDKKLITLMDVVKGYNGKMRVGRRWVTDEHKFGWIGAEDIIVHSSNIGMYQLAQKMSATGIYNGLSSFGLTEISGVDLPYEQKGRLPSLKQLGTEVYKGSVSYGYSVSVTFMQMLRAYSAFNNSGLMVTPSIVDQAITYEDRFIKKSTTKRAISSQTAQQMKKILQKVVQKGTGVGARIDGLDIGGKTGTAHISKNGRYVREYNSSFFGYANDKNHRYTIGVTVIQPQSTHFASQTAVPVFTSIVNRLLSQDYLKRME
jgi:cell division protein FtsI (penicillin-binding protein 3)